MTQVAEDTFSGSIAAGATKTLTVDTDHAGTVALLVDGGATGTAPASYDAEFRGRSAGLERMQVVSAVTGSTAFSHTEDAAGDSMEVVLTNASAGAADYALTFEARR